MTNKRLIFAAGLVAAGIAAGAAASSTGTTPIATGEPVRCEILAERSGAMIRLSGLMHADRDVSGEYRFNVQSTGRGGSTDISQGSRFHAGPNGPTTLGMVMLSAGGVYDVELDVTANGETFRCAERVGGII
ncbi:MULTISPECIES: curli-like amyloid fiber formation chaperone CsgH [unclassified Roseitalea]|uniref:curli-like amyloid fiber formation chaperone CsgH n=1 Tax=unclassified Roseitalea TaxID=2639107 RepID=UPI00273E88F9|nr:MULTISPECIES: curli-like amyloid fiber formation chaperone CsgH [unclassified Roseitalea]